MNRIIKNYIKTIVVCLVSMLFVTSCKPIDIPNPVVEVDEWSKGMVMIIVAEEKNAFEKAFNKDVWSLKSSTNFESYDNYIIANVKEYVQKLMTVNLMLENSSVGPNTEERVLLENCAKEYYGNLTKGDKEFINCTEQEVFKLYIEYFKATNIANMLIQGADDEISVSEAKVIEVEQIKVDNLEEANEIKNKLMQKGAAFSYYAKQYSKDPITTYEVERGSLMASHFPELFYLNTGDISDVIEYNGSYYIFKCKNGYKERETLRRRDDIIKAIRQKAFDEQFNKFQVDHKIYLKAPYWDDIKLSIENDCTVNNFFTIYNKYFAESN